MSFLLSARTNAQLGPDATQSTTHDTISSSSPLCPKDLDYSAFLPSLFILTSCCMDLSRHGRPSDGQRPLRPQQSSSSLRRSSASAGNLRSQPHSTPLPQRQWSELPMPYRPRNWQESEQPTQHPDPSFAWRLSQISSSERNVRRSAGGLASRRHRSPRALQSIRSRAEDDIEASSIDPTLLYPQMSPYDNQLTAVSAPDELEHPHITVSQPSTPDWMRLQQEPPEPNSALPRSPTYPPTGTGRRRFHSASGVTDAAFQDEHDFRLFVEATAGLGPIPAFRHEQSSSSSSRQRSRHEDDSNDRQSRVDFPVSPIEESPIAERAMHGLPQMPFDNALTRRNDQPTQRQRLETSASGLDLWLQPPSATASHDWTSVPDIVQDDDELPDYASSQAQAQAAQRVEAARRAEELQRRWRESGGRSARYE